MYVNFGKVQQMHCGHCACQSFSGRCCCHTHTHPVQLLVTNNCCCQLRVATTVVVVDPCAVVKASEHAFFILIFCFVQSKGMLVPSHSCFIISMTLLLIRRQLFQLFFCMKKICFDSVSLLLIVLLFLENMILPINVSDLSVFHVFSFYVHKF